MRTTLVNRFKGIKGYTEQHVLKDISFDHYYSSTSERCCDTIELIIGDHYYKRLKGLKERNFGLFEGESEDLNPNFDDFGYDDLFPHYGGERKEDVQKRLKETLTDVMNKEDHQTVLALSHAGACMCFLSTVIDPEEILKSGGFTNCCILHFTFENDTFKFVEIIRP